MSTITLDSDMLYNFNIVASDESLRERLARYLRKLVRERDNDPTCMTKEEYFAMIGESQAQADRGEGVVFTNLDAMHQWANAL